MSNPKPTMTRAEVARLANLARIELSAAELDHLAPQLAVIVESVAAVNEVAADDIPPSSHALPLENVLRPDELRPSLTAEQALSGAPEVDRQRFSVPRILSEEP
ncbi:MAG: Asp-tRNA(Asn)/Glu-tRNA(Gln) amidotransferase subunit GatC [Nocardioidaceae bacterium]